MELVKNYVKKAMPSLSSDQMDTLMAKLEELGVLSVDDLSLVDPEDIKDTLPFIQCKRFVRAVKALEADSQTPPQFTRPGPSSTPEPQRFQLPSTPPETADSPSQDTYSVPWHKFPSKVMDELREKKYIMGKDRREMVRIVAEDYLHKHPGRPGRQKLRELASMIVGQYPASFKLTEPFGNKPFAKDGSETLFRQLEHRIENMKRPQSSLKRQAGGENSTKKRPRNSDLYGCVAWDPIIEGAVCREDLLSKRDELKRAFQTQDLQESSVRKLMTETYPIQREILNDDDTTIAVVKDEWPFLFEVPHLFDHASKLLGFSVQNKLAQISADPEVELPVTPCILIRGDQQFKIAVDGLLVNDHITSPIVALSYVFSMFYVCNVQYPPEMAFTLEFMQRVFFGVNPERGSKAEKKGKKRHFIPPQVCKLVSQLKEFECKQKESEWAI
ncbi:uncharacterized protein LOC120714460 isoform X3 [Simochromis diagramma]|uniref:uncharacterized protein LOC120714460 isoform X3 n=1 Tax=Simochromis diagramma TaxID=43689 RepID=UPI001A7EDBF0|nr:uncharacterized protein LOC120714460 isoform X3 [Simochromis diagramma]